MSARKKPALHSTVNRDRPANTPPVPLPAPKTRGKTRPRLSFAKPLGRPPGRAAGPNKARTKPSVPHEGSLYARMAALDVGAYVYIEVEKFEDMQRLQSRVSTPASRLADSMKHMDFTSAGFTAVPALSGLPRFIVRVERTK